MPIKNAFIFDSLIKDYKIYKELANKYNNYTDQIKVFQRIREEAVDQNLKQNISVYKQLINNILLTDVKKSVPEKLEIAQKYFVKDFYKTPVYYGFHLLNFNSPNFMVDNVQFINKNIFFDTIDKYGAVILNPLHNDLYQMLTNYLSVLNKDVVYSLYGIETSLKKISKINKLYTPVVNNIEYNYVTDTYGLPYPLILKKALKDIKMHKLVAIPPEISMGLGPQHTVELLGKRVSMPLGSSWVSNKTQVPVIIVHTEMEDTFKIKIKFEQPIGPFPKSKNNIIKQSQLIFNSIDRIVRENPYSWCGYDTFNRIIVS